MGAKEREKGGARERGNKTFEMRECLCEKGRDKEFK